MTPFEITMATSAALLGVALLAFWVAMIRDCWVRTVPGSRQRWVWLAIIVFGKLFGALAYYLLRDQVGGPSDLAPRAC